MTDWRICNLVRKKDRRFLKHWGASMSRWGVRAPWGEGVPQVLGVDVDV